MVAIEPFPVAPKRPDPATLDLRNVVFSYDRRSDIFVVHLFGPKRPAKVVHTGMTLDLRLDPATEIIIGFQIEGYLAQAVYQQPYLLDLAGFTDIPRAEIEEIRRQIILDDDQVKRALVDRLFGQAVLASA